jgi:hypothetical protein
MRAIFTFSERIFPPLQSFEIVGSKCLPPNLAKTVLDEVRESYPDKPTGVAVLSMMRDGVQHAYEEMGYELSSVQRFDGLETGYVKMIVNEPVVGKVNIMFIDDNMQVRLFASEELLPVLTLRAAPHVLLACHCMRRRRCKPQCSESCCCSGL